MGGYWVGRFYNFWVQLSVWRGVNWAQTCLPQSFPGYRIFHWDRKQDAIAISKSKTITDWLTDSLTHRLLWQLKMWKNLPVPPEEPVVAWARTWSARGEGGRRSNRWAVELLPLKLSLSSLIVILDLLHDQWSLLSRHAIGCVSEFNKCSPRYNVEFMPTVNF